MEDIDFLPSCRIYETLPDKCFVCDKHFKHYNWYTVSKDYNMLEVDIRTAHSSCNKLMKRRQLLLDELLEIDYDLFMKSC
jgi:hypothetical protein